MSTKKKLLQAAAGTAAAASGSSINDVESLFHTFVYDGTSLGQTINANLNLGDDTEEKVSVLLTGDNTSDSGPNSLTTTVNGVTVDTGTKKFGTGSLRFNGQATITVDDESILLGYRDFTIEFWLRVDSLAALKGIMNVGNPSDYTDYSVGMYFTSSGEIGVQARNSPNDSGGRSANTPTNTIAANTWYHIALVRQDTDLTLYVDGTSKSTINLYDNCFGFKQLELGTHWGTSGGDDYRFTGYIDDFRLSRKAVYTGNFTAPSAAHSTSFTSTTGDGGLVWIKARNKTDGHALIDTVRGADYELIPNDSGASGSATQKNYSFNGNGLQMYTADGQVNNSSYQHVAWSFLKKEKFMDIISYSGNGGSSANEQAVSHNLGVKPALVIIKRTDASGDWWVLTDKIDGSNDYGKLNEQNAFANTSNNPPSSTAFNVGGVLNTNGGSYIAYLFAHNFSATDDTQTSLVGKTFTDENSNIDSSYPLSKINDGTIDSNNTNMAYTSGVLDVSWDMGSATVVNTYYIAPQSLSGTVYNPVQGFTAYGSNDNSNWTSIQTVTGLTNTDYYAGKYSRFKFTNTTAYRYYRLETNHSGASISELNVGVAPSTADLQSGFGENGDTPMIKVGWYQGGGSSGDSQQIDIGMKPQWLLIKNVYNTTDWHIFDMMRVWRKPTAQSGDSFTIKANSNVSEVGVARIYPTSEGFGFEQETNTQVNAGGENNRFLYMAIRFPMKQPTSSREVFSISNLKGYEPFFSANHKVDMGLVKSAGSSNNWFNYARIFGEKYLPLNADSPEGNATEAGFDFMHGHIDQNWGGTNTYSWMWKAAEGFFNEISWTGSGAVRTLKHHLNKTPEMIWVRGRSLTEDWTCYFAALGNQKYLQINGTGAAGASGTGVGQANLWNNTTPTSTVFTVGTHGRVNTSGEKYVAYAFTSLDGVAKCGSYTGTGSTINVDCGFSNGAKYVFIRNAYATGNWLTWDSSRGISTSNNDPYLTFNSTDQQYTDAGSRDIGPYSSGFSVTGTDSDINTNGNTYVFYAIAEP